MDSMKEELKLTTCRLIKGTYFRDLEYEKFEHKLLHLVTRRTLITPIHNLMHFTGHSESVLGSSK